MFALERLGSVRGGVWKLMAMIKPLGIYEAVYFTGTSGKRFSTGFRKLESHHLWRLTGYKDFLKSCALYESGNL